MNTITFTLKLFYTILHYQQHKQTNIYYYFCKNQQCLHFLYKNLIFYITKILLNFIKLQKLLVYKIFNLNKRKIIFFNKLMSKITSTLYDTRSNCCNSKLILYCKLVFNNFIIDYANVLKYQ